MTVKWGLFIFDFCMMLPMIFMLHKSECALELRMCILYFCGNRKPSNYFQFEILAQLCSQMN